MNALPSDPARVAGTATPAPLAAARGSPRSRALSFLAEPGARQNLVILTVFWIYVACSNTLYANNMQASIVASYPEASHVFAPWSARLIQHLAMYPVLLLCVWASLRIGWAPLWRRAPWQVLLALGFAVWGSPAMSLGEYLTSRHEWRDHLMQGGAFMLWNGDDLPMWLASVTMFSLTYGFALALVMGFAFYRRLRDAQLRSAALERALGAAHLAALRMQLSPHTLFNLLHTIRGQIGWDPAAAQAMVVQLGDLLRRLLTAGERDFSRLSDELQFVRLYLGLQQRRFADRLTVNVPEPESLPAAWVPSLILQPLVENAVVHGLAGHEGQVAVRVDAVVSEEMLCLRVVNTVAAEKPQGCAGIGLRNVRERLAIQFGERAAFSAMPGYDNVWIAEVRLPLLRDGPAAPARPARE
ncbi:MAG TPA: histidine kinase [Steroidobacteraceae bacterium]|nr:histidine kinase [Steroidobacteraceae bacterium]